jgi:UDP-N-acetylglucosamine--N-acetylmuramyl-(pentapeptide) pyrophosphoryl-undecaprenol N-acetylglucosamine transferase
MHVVLAGGGTAGHIEPALNTADALRALSCGDTISVLGTSRGLETTLVPARGYELTLIPATPLPRRINKDLLTLPFRLRRAIREVEKHLADKQADVVVGFGGYVAIPAYLAAKRAGVPIVVHEANARPGLANRIGARYATAIVDTVAGSLTHATTLGLPLRHAIRNLNKSTAKSAAVEVWGLDPQKKTILVFGGSQGARHLNEVVAKAAPLLVAKGYQILHSVGKANADHLVTNVAGYKTVPYIDSMEFAYGIADVAITRAGAMTVAELTAVGIPALYVPLPIGNGEQRLNALPVVHAGGGALVDDADLTPEIIETTMIGWLEGDLEAVKSAAARCGHKDAVDQFVGIIRSAAQKSSHKRGAK